MMMQWRCAVIDDVETQLDDTLETRRDDTV